MFHAQSRTGFDRMWLTPHFLKNFDINPINDFRVLTQHLNLKATMLGFQVFIQYTGSEEQQNPDSAEDWVAVMYRCFCEDQRREFVRA